MTMHESMLTTKIRHEGDMREVEIIKFIKQNPGCTTNQVVNHMGFQKTLLSRK